MRILLSEVLAKIKQEDTIIIGSLLYWHNICGAVRDLLEYKGMTSNSAEAAKLGRSI